MEPKTEFEIGDNVQAWGWKGVVTEVTGEGEYPVGVRFSNGMVCTFRPDGKERSWHLLPALSLVSRRPVKVKMYQAIVPGTGTNYPTISTFIYYSKAEAMAPKEYGRLKPLGFVEIEVKNE